MENAHTSQRNIFLDLFKYVLVFLVISIHYNSYSLLMPVFRVAVPMFFMISGFYNYADSKEKRLKKCYGFMKSSLKYLLIGTIIYFVYDIYKCIFNGENVVEFVDRLFYKDFSNDFIIFNTSNTSGYHLWFLIALFVCSLIHYLFVETDNCKLYYYLTPILFILVFSMNGYLHLVFDYSQPIEHYRNVLFMGMPLFSTGFLLGKFRNKQFSSKIKVLFALLGSYFLFFSTYEKTLIKMEFYISSVLASIFLLLFFNSLSIKDNKFTKFYYKWIGKNSVFYIYIFHIMVYEIFVSSIVTSATIKCLLTFLFSFAIYEILHLFGLLINHIKTNKRKNDSVTKNLSKNIVTEKQTNQI